MNTLRQATGLGLTLLDQCTTEEAYRSARHLAAAARDDVADLCVARFAQPALSVGTFHALRQESPYLERCARRLSGGRIVPIGAPFLNVSLSLSHPSALVSSSCWALRPEQILNRCVRGVLRSLRTLGVDAHYPGRDWITSRGRIIGMASFGIPFQTRTVIDIVLANSAGFELLPAQLDEIDPQSLLFAEFLAPADTTYLRQETGAALEIEAAMSLFAQGYTQEFHLELVDAPPPVAGEPLANVPSWSVWQRQRVDDPRRQRRAVRRSQMGGVFVHLSMDDSGRFTDVLIGGDILAPVATIDTMQRNLLGLSPQAADVHRVLAASLSEEGSFVLGLGADAVEMLSTLVLEAAAHE